MLPHRKFRLLAFPSLATRDAKRLERQGYAWSGYAVGDVKARWLVTNAWREAKTPQRPGADGFVPVAAFAEGTHGGIAALRYTRCATPIDLGDFLDALDPRRFTQGDTYLIENAFVAERVGRSTNGGLVGPPPTVWVHTCSTLPRKCPSEGAKRWKFCGAFMMHCGSACVHLE